MSSASTDDLGKLVLRLTVGVLMLFHGIAKLGSGVGSIESMLAFRGLPESIAWGVYLGEVIAPLLLIAGSYSRLAGLIIAVNMVFAVFLVHMGHLFMFTQTGGWRLELQAFFLFGAVAIMLLGAGRFSLSGPGGKWN
jgi:putative oxidoreductase